MSSAIDHYPLVRPTSRRTWRAWLQRYHRTAGGVWIVFAKKSAGPQPLSYDAAVEEALCFGWIDGLLRSIDERSYQQLFSPRKPGSTWSASNRRRVSAMVKAGRMTEAGMAKVRAARRDGTWTVLAKIDRLVMPPDLARALRANAKARAGFARWSTSTQRGALWWLHTAKRPETRQARLREIVAAASRGTKPRPMRVTS